MPDYKGMLKNGWHPEKEGGLIRGHVKSLIGRGDSTERRDSNHVARPLSSLQDPASFGPPPKHVNAGSPAAATAAVGAAPSPQQYQSQPASPALPNRPGAEADAPPPKPYRVDTTGLSTAHLPPPPGRRDGAGARSPPATAAPGKPGPPALPPRLPPRSSAAALPAYSARSATSPSSTPAQSSYSYALPNQGAVNRLAAAGISVPALGIGESDQSSPPPPPPPPRNATSPAGNGNSQFHALRSGFAKPGSTFSSLNGSSGGGSTPSQGTTLAQKQAALHTATALRQDPGSVSMSDARAAASTLNNFRQRHGDEVAAGWRSANDTNEKYGVADRVGARTGAEAGATDRPVGAVGALATAGGMLGKKKPPPPPPKKKPDAARLAQAYSDDGGDEAPPVPMSTRPQF